MSTPLLIALGVGAAVAAALIGFLLWRAVMSRALEDDPLQARLAVPLDAYLYSAQDETDYAALRAAVRRAFAEAGPDAIRSHGRQQRLLYATTLGQKHVKSGLKPKPTRAQIEGASKAIIRLSEEP